MHALVEAHSDSILEARVPVLDGIDVRDYLAGDSTFLTRFADRSDFRLLVLVNQALRQLPPVVRADCDDHNFDVIAVASKNHAPRRSLIANRNLDRGAFGLRAVGLTRRHLPAVA